MSAPGHKRPVVCAAHCNPGYFRKAEEEDAQNNTPCINRLLVVEVKMVKMNTCFYASFSIQSPCPASYLLELITFKFLLDLFISSVPTVMFIYI